MNVNMGGKQPRMRPGWYLRNGVRFKQHMVFEGGPHEGIAKGLRQVCSERFGAEKITGRTNKKWGHMTLITLPESGQIRGGLF